MLACLQCIPCNIYLSNDQNLCSAFNSLSSERGRGLKVDLCRLHVIFKRNLSTNLSYRYISYFLNNLSFKQGFRETIINVCFILKTLHYS